MWKEASGKLLRRLDLVPVQDGDQYGGRQQEQDEDAYG